MAEDLAQDTFLRATRAFLGWRGGRPEAWLLAIARNVLMDAQRRGRPTLPLDEELLPSIGQGDAATRAAVRDALGRLPWSQSRLLTLVHIDGFTHAEVAQMTGSTRPARRFHADRSTATTPATVLHAPARHHSDDRRTRRAARTRNRFGTTAFMTKSRKMALRSSTNGHAALSGEVKGRSRLTISANSKTEAAASANSTVAVRREIEVPIHYRNRQSDSDM
jgi:hypothetical protein